MGKSNFTLICRACIFEPACRMLGISTISRLKPQPIQRRLFRPIQYYSKKPYFQLCKRMIVISFAVTWYLGLFCFYRWGGIFKLFVPIKTNNIHYHYCQGKKSPFLFKLYSLSNFFNGTEFKPPNITRQS